VSTNASLINPRAPVARFIAIPVPIPDAASCAFGVTTASVMESFVTPWAVAPPFFDPGPNGTTQTPPEPSNTKLKRPYGPASRSHAGLLIAAAVPMPVPAGGLPTPGARPLVDVAAALVTVVADAITTATTSVPKTRRRASVRSGMGPLPFCGTED
jgi:hypothetical protein